MGDVDRYAWYMEQMQQRNLAMVVLAGLVLVALLWYALLGRWPRLRRWLCWLSVAGYLALMLVMVWMKPVF